MCVCQVKAVLDTALSETDAPLAVGDLRHGPVISSVSTPFSSTTVVLAAWYKSSAIILLYYIHRMYSSSHVFRTTNSQRKDTIIS